MKIKIVLLLIEAFTLVVLSNAGVQAQTTLTILIVGAVLGGLFKVLWDLGQVRHREIKLVIIDVLANIVLVGGLGMVGWYGLDWYLNLTPKILSGELTIELVFSTILAIGFVTVAGGRSGLRWSSKIVKTFIENRVGRVHKTNE